jgi:hypothetical protein
MDQATWNPTGTELESILAEMRPIVLAFARRDAVLLALGSAGIEPATIGS